MFSDNRTYGGASSVQILYRNNTKVYQCDKCCKLLLFKDIGTAKTLVYGYETKDIDLTTFT